MLSSCGISIYSWKDNEEKVKTKPGKMEIKKKTPKPSITFSLDQAYSDYVIKLTNDHSK